MKQLEDALYEYGRSDIYPFHMPGHKRQDMPFFSESAQGQQVTELFNRIFKMDLTEIEGFDNLHDPQGILLQLMEEMRAFYGTRKTCLLVNGSTAGILSSISACTERGDTVLAARNCHKSVWNACFLRDLKVRYILPEVLEKGGIYGGIKPEDVEEQLEKDPSVKAVILVSPTYEGIVSDVEAIAEIVHARGGVLIVDEAHGAHLPFAPEHSRFPKSALSCGADLVIQSVHKTLPAMTQTALLHINSDRVPEEEVERYLGIYQTSSPSYILMASISLCFHYMKTQGAVRMREYEKRLLSLREQLQSLKILSILSKNIVGKKSVFDYDIGKLVFITEGTGWTGTRLGDWLRERFHLELEMSSVGYAVAMTSAADTEEGYARLLKAVRAIKEDDSPAEGGSAVDPASWMRNLPAQRMSSAQAHRQKGVYRDFADSLGSVSKETLFVYPPGTAFLIAGEVIDETVLSQVKWYEENGFSISGMSRKNRFFVTEE